MKQAICPICQSEMSFRFSVPCDYRNPNVNKNYKIFWCGKCDYGQVWARPSKQEIEEFYNLENYYTHKETKKVSNYEKTLFFDRLRTHIAWRFDDGRDFGIEEIESFLKDDNLTVCEIGCGNGKNLSQFLVRGFDVCGVEPDSAAREVAFKSIKNVYDGSAEELPKSVLDRKYDVVLMSHVLEHCLDINTAILNAQNLLKEEGILIIEVPNCKSLGFNLYQGEWPWSDIPRHLNFLTSSSLFKIINKHNLKIVSKQYRGFSRQFSNSWLENEEEVWSAFNKYDRQKRTKPNFKLRACKLLVKSLLSSNELKYDSVRVIAQL